MTKMRHSARVRPSLIAACPVVVVAGVLFRRHIDEMGKYGAKELFDSEFSLGMPVTNGANQLHFDRSCGQNISRFHETQFFSAVVAELFSSS